jgi:hypothetical protein
MQSIIPPPGRPEPNYDDIERAQLAARTTRGAHWFYWIAALSLVNTVISIGGGGWTFGLGLACTQVVDALASHVEGPARYGVIAVGFICAGVFAIFGWLGTRYQTWAIMVGIVLYVADGLLLIGLMLASQQPLIIGLAIHAYATYALVKGFLACRQYHLVLARSVPPGPPAPPTQEIMSTMGQH